MSPDTSLTILLNSLLIAQIPSSTFPPPLQPLSDVPSSARSPAPAKDLVDQLLRLIKFPHPDASHSPAGLEIPTPIPASASDAFFDAFLDAQTSLNAAKDAAEIEKAAASTPMGRLRSKGSRGGHLPSSQSTPTPMLASSPDPLRMGARASTSALARNASSSDAQSPSVESALPGSEDDVVMDVAGAQSNRLAVQLPITPERRDSPTGVESAVKRIQLGRASGTGTGRGAVRGGGDHSSSRFTL